jgi:predicted transcriptional regulator
MVRDFINRVFNGATEPLLVHLVEEHDLSPEELEEIAHLRRKP